MKMTGNMPTQRRELLPQCRFLWVKRFFHEEFACFLCIPGILTYSQKFYASGKLKTHGLLTASCPGGICCLWSKSFWDKLKSLGDPRQTKCRKLWICVFWDLFVSLMLRGVQVLRFILLSPFVYIWWKVLLEVFDVFIIDCNSYNPLVSLFSLEHRLVTSCWSTRCWSVKLSWQVLWWWHGSVAKARKLVWTWSWLLENYRAMLIKACHITNRLHLHNACVCVSRGRKTQEMFAFRKCHCELL